MQHNLKVLTQENLYFLKRNSILIYILPRVNFPNNFFILLLNYYRLEQYIKQTVLLNSGKLQNQLQVLLSKDPESKRKYSGFVQSTIYENSEYNVKNLIYFVQISWNHSKFQNSTGKHIQAIKPYNFQLLIFQDLFWLLQLFQYTSQLHLNMNLKYLSGLIKNLSSKDLEYFFFCTTPISLPQKEAMTLL